MRTEGSLEGKVAFVTGMGRGQGRSHAVRLAREGAAIIGVDALKTYPWMNYRLAVEADVEETIRLVEQEGGEIHFQIADVTDLSTLERALGEGVARFGRLDIVVANAGALPAGALTWDADPAYWRECVDVNLIGGFHTVHAAVPHILAGGRGGSIVVTSSGAAITAGSHLSDYCAAKAALLSLVRTLAVELAPHWVRVNAVCPGAVDTNMIANEALYRMLRPDLEAPTREDTIEIWRSKTLLPVPWVEPADISNAVVWLASDESRYVTGVVLPVDAGSTITFA
ncbi:MAG: mycofactocin-coupled SDR family oxidoreductase [Acidimicrobiales bacterium]